MSWGMELVFFVKFNLDVSGAGKPALILFIHNEVVFA
jgi:hypothetical protein